MKMSDLPDSVDASYRNVTVRGVRAGAQFAGSDSIAEEVPVAFEYNGISHAVMMATPADLHDFAVGFSITEGIVETAAQIYDYEVVQSAEGYTLKLEIAASCFARLKEKRRNLTGRTGCGICGSESLTHAIRHPAPLQQHAKFEIAAITKAVAGLRERQALLALTGASHAAAWSSADGSIQLLREDVGRHNALDKLVGALCRNHIVASEGFIIITSRASFEMVQKAVTAGVSLLAAVSGVTGLAVELAQQSGLTLLGFTRGDDFSAYSHCDKLRGLR